MAGGGDETAARPLLGKKVQHVDRCPGCRLDEINKTKTGIPYLNFFYIWVVCLSAWQVKATYDVNGIKGGIMEI